MSILIFYIPYYGKHEKKIIFILEPQLARIHDLVGVKNFFDFL